MAESGTATLKTENHFYSSNPTADDVMDSTEINSASDQEEVPVEGPHDMDERGDEAIITDPEDNDAGGLFGSGSEDEGDASSNSGKKRKLDDTDLDSGDDEDRKDGAEDGMDGYGEEAIETQQSVNVVDISHPRQAFPRSVDGDTYLLRLPHFAGIEPKSFALKSFQPPETDHHSEGRPPTSTFSAAQTSKTTLRWRHGPRDHKRLQSNARVIRWSDHSLTIQLASAPTTQYELPSKPLAPAPTAPYDARMDSHTYLASVNQSTSFALITSHLTKSLTVQDSGEQNDDALIRLQEAMAAAVKGNKNAPDGGVATISISEDPELAKKRAELAEREKVRAQKRRQNQEERERDRASRVLGRSGLRHGGIGASGLTVGGLEDDDGLGGAASGGARGQRAKPTWKPRRRNSEYSDDDEDFRNRGRTKEDEYDEDDGFLVGSDEEPELVADDESEEEEMGDDGEVEPKAKKSKGDKLDVSAARNKRRRVVDDDEDDE